MFKNHTSSIAAALVIGWFIFITYRGQLPTYLGILGIGPTPSGCGGSSLGGLIGNLGGIIGASTGQGVGTPGQGGNGGGGTSSPPISTPQPISNIPIE